MAAKPELERRFSATLGGCRPPQFLRYRTGDFFRAHSDGDGDGEAANQVARRQISVVVFLNDETTEPRPGCYVGGALTFYGLLDAAPQLGLPVGGRAGRLVAFDATRLHAVTPVTHGERCTFVTWFL
jgi:SM-20-related protein